MLQQCYWQPQQNQPQVSLHSQTLEVITPKGQEDGEGRAREQDTPEAGTFLVLQSYVL